MEIDRKATAFDSLQYFKESIVIFSTTDVRIPDVMTMACVGLKVDGEGGRFDLYYFMTAKRLVYVKHGDPSFVATPGGVL
jgi:hypothetical protein